MLKRLELLIPPPIIALLCGCIMWGVARAFPDFALSFSYQAAAGYALIAIGASFDLVSIAGFFKAKTTVTPLSPEKASSLVTDGMYRVTRNPMYLGLLFILTGIALLLGSPVNVAVLIAFAAYITTFQIKPEEKQLSQIFGAEYEDYTSRVRRWL